MQTIQRNANRLFQDGYRCELVTGDGLFRVFNLDRPESNYTIETRGMKTCECTCFKRFGLCKHLSGLVLLVQAQINSYYLRLHTLRQDFKRFRGGWQEKQYRQAFIDKIENACWELECALGDLTGTAEFYMPRRLVGFVPECEDVTEGRRAA